MQGQQKGSKGMTDSTRKPYGGKGSARGSKKGADNWAGLPAAPGADAAMVGPAVVVGQPMGYDPAAHHEQPHVVGAAGAGATTGWNGYNEGNPSGQQPPYYSNQPPQQMQAVYMAGPGVSYSHGYGMQCHTGGGKQEDEEAMGAFKHLCCCCCCYGLLAPCNWVGMYFLWQSRQARQNLSGIETTQRHEMMSGIRVPPQVQTMRAHDSKALAERKDSAWAQHTKCFMWSVYGVVLIWAFWIILFVVFFSAAKSEQQNQVNSHHHSWKQ